MMASRIDASTYRGEAPWKGLGVNVSRIQDLDAMLEKSGLGWQVDTAALKFRDASQKWRTAQTADGSEMFALYRADTGESLDLVGPNYVAHQNREVLEFFRGYAQAGNLTLEMLGTLNGGRYVWALANTGASFTLPGGDQVDGYILLVNPHQYAKAFMAKFMAVRHKGHLTFSENLPGQPRMWHVRPWDAQVMGEATRRLGLARERFEAFQSEAEKLAKTTLHPEAAELLAHKLFGGDGPRSRRILQLFGGDGIGAKLASSAGTAWGFACAAAQYVDHELGRTQNKRVFHAWLAEGERMKLQAVRELLKGA
jgi:phage/plasmid-like protein (TIGR03299 family)